MQFLNLTLPTLSENLALDEALLVQAESGAGSEVLRIWHWPSHAVVLGAGGVLADDVNLDRCRQDQVAIARRSSGGGTVLLGPGCLLFSLVLDMEARPEMQILAASYRAILERLLAALTGLLPDLKPHGISDLTSAGRKFSGNAQQRKRRFLLHHGTLLHGFDLGKIGEYLTLPPRRPEYRSDRSHEDFLVNLPDRPEALEACLRLAWRADAAAVPIPMKSIQELVESKYSRDDWVFRR